MRVDSRPERRPSANTRRKEACETPTNVVGDCHRAELPVNSRESTWIRKKHAWQALLQDAVHETEPDKAEAKTHAAEAAILNRLGDTWPSPGFAEEQELFQALDTIRLLKGSQRLSKLAQPEKQKGRSTSPATRGTKVQR